MTQPLQVSEPFPPESHAEDVQHSTHPCISAPWMRLSQLSTEYLQHRVALWCYLCSGCSVPMGWLLFEHRDGCASFFLVFTYPQDTVLWSCSQKELDLCLSTSFPQALWAMGHWKAELEKASRQCLFCPWAVPLDISSQVSFFHRGKKLQWGKW